jgi:hypothetical protein
LLPQATAGSCQWRRYSLCRLSETERNVKETKLGSLQLALSDL